MNANNLKVTLISLLAIFGNNLVNAESDSEKVIVIDGQEISDIDKDIDASLEEKLNELKKFENKKQLTEEDRQKLREEIEKVKEEFSKIREKAQEISGKYKDIRLEKVERTVKEYQHGREDSEKITKELDLKDIKTIVINSVDGDILVKNSSDKKLYLSIESSEKFENKCSLKDTKSKDVLTIEIERKDLKGCQVDLEASMPNQISLQVKSRIGDIQIKGKFENVEIKNIKGEINIDGEFKNLDANSGSGDIRIVGSGKNVNMFSGSGDLNIDGKFEELKSRSGSGDTGVNGSFKSVEMSGASGDISGGFTTMIAEAHTASGDLRLDMSGQKEAITAKVYSASGDVSVKVPAKEIDGKFRSSSGDVSQSVKLNEKSNFKLDVSSASGDIVIK